MASQKVISEVHLISSNHELYCEEIFCFGRFSERCRPDQEQVSGFGVLINMVRLSFHTICCQSLRNLSLAFALACVPVVAETTGAASTDPSAQPESDAQSTPAADLMPKAKAVDLGEPVAVPTAPPSPLHAVSEPFEEEAVPEAIAPVAEEGKTIILLGAKVAPATATRLSWSPSQSFEGIATPTPVLVVNGANAGPTLCLTAAVHGDELNGIEIVRRVLYNLDENKLSGTVIGVPIVNLQGFHRSSRYLPDRRDLNRFFPGNPTESSAARIAHSFFNEIISHCDALVDLHTGSFYRTNLPQLRADLSDPAVLELTQGFGATVVLHSEGQPGTLRYAAVSAGIPAVTLEAGEPMRLQESEVDHGVRGIQTLLNKMSMYKRSSFWGEPAPVYYKSAWVRADQGGILFSKVELGERVKADEILGTVTDPITNVRTEIHSPYNGKVLGMALNQVVMPGFAAYRIGIQTSEDEVSKPAAGDSTLPAPHTAETLPDEDSDESRIAQAGDLDGLEDSE